MAVRLFLGVVVAARGAFAWGALGHATVAYVAQNYLNDDTASWAQNILGDTSDSYLASIASWADEYRETSAGAWSAGFHFIDAEDNPPSTCDVNYDRDCGSGGCSISAMANYTQRVADNSLSSEQIAEALKFIVHFTGDLTQPLHDEAYQVGGNEIEVTFNGYKDNLHADWDTYMPEKLIGGSSLSDAQTWANELIQSIDSGSYESQASSWINGDTVSDVITTSTRWASDANAYVCSTVMPKGASALQSGDLYPKYYNSVIPTIELQIAKAGYRLANWLNIIYTNDITKRSLPAGMVRRARMTAEMYLPNPRPMSEAKLARAAAGGSCNCGKHRR